MSGIKLDKEILDVVYTCYNRGFSKYLIHPNTKRYMKSYGLHRVLHLDDIMQSWSDRT